MDNFSKFKQSDLGEINEKVREQKKSVRKAILSLILVLLIYVILIVIVVEYKINKILIYIIAFIIIFIWAVYWFKILNRIVSLELSNRDKVLQNLYNALNHIKNYNTQKKSDDFKNLFNSLEKLLKNISKVQFYAFDTPWELKSNSLFTQIETYIESEALILRMSDNEKFSEVEQTLEKIFDGLYINEYDDVLNELTKINEHHKKSKKNMIEKYRPFFEKYNLNIDSFVNFFVGVIILVLIFFLYWGMSKWLKFQFSVYIGTTISLTSTVALYYGIKIVKELRRT